MKAMAGVVSAGRFANASFVFVVLTVGAVPASAQRTDPLAHDSLSRASRARLHGVVASQSTKTPVSAADVWAISADVHVRSDSAGQFRFDDLPAGQLLIEIRHIGFDVRRDTIALEGGKETVRHFSLAPNAPLLDTVRSLGQEPKYLSPMLRGFEERRLSRQGGQFISDSVLRANENTTLANILGRISGATITTGPKHARVLVSTRKPCNGPAFRMCTRPDCYVEIYLDGVLMFSPGMGGDVPDLAKMMSLTDLAGIEYYAGGASMPIGMHSSTDQGCGSLWLWTREK